MRSAVVPLTILPIPMVIYCSMITDPATRDVGYGSGYVRPQPHLRRDSWLMMMTRTSGSSGQSVYWNSEAADTATKWATPARWKTARGKETMHNVTAQFANRPYDDGMTFGLILNVVILFVNIVVGSPALYVPPQPVLNDRFNTKHVPKALVVEVWAT